MAENNEKEVEELALIMFKSDSGGKRQWEDFERTRYMNDASVVIEAGYSKQSPLPQNCDNSIKGQINVPQMINYPSKQLVPLDEKEVLSMLSNKQDYEQLPFTTRRKIARNICSKFGSPAKIELPSISNLERIASECEDAYQSALTQELIEEVGKLRDLIERKMK